MEILSRFAEYRKEVGHYQVPPSILTYRTIGLQRYPGYETLGRLAAGSLYYNAYITWDSDGSNPSLTFRNPKEQVQEGIEYQGTGSSVKGTAERISISYNNVPPRP